MGLANKLAIRCGGKILRAFASGNDQVVGIPLRESIVALAQVDGIERQLKKVESRKKLNLDQQVPTILVFGGSLGSNKI